MLEKIDLYRVFALRPSPASVKVAADTLVTRLRAQPTGQCNMTERVKILRSSTTERRCPTKENANLVRRGSIFGIFLQAL